MWLRRKEAEIFQTRVMAQGMADLMKEGKDSIAQVFKSYTNSLLPFLAKEQSKTDEKLREVMKREVDKGMIVFNAPQDHPFVQRARAISMPDEVRQKIAAAQQKRLGRKGIS